MNNSIQTQMSRVESDATDIEKLTSDCPTTLANLSSMLMTVGRNEQVMKNAMIAKSGEVGEIVVKQSEWLTETGLERYKSKIRSRVDELRTQITSLKTYQNHDNSNSIFRTTREQLELIYKDHVKFSAKIMAPQKALSRLLPALDQKKIPISIVQNFVACCCTYNKLMFNSNNTYVETPENAIWRFEENKLKLYMKQRITEKSDNMAIYTSVLECIKNKKIVSNLVEIIKTYVSLKSENEKFGKLLNTIFIMLGLNSTTVTDIYKKFDNTFSFPFATIDRSSNFFRTSMKANNPIANSLHLVGFGDVGSVTSRARGLIHVFPNNEMLIMSPQNDVCTVRGDGGFILKANGSASRTELLKLGMKRARGDMEMGSMAFDVDAPSSSLLRAGSVGLAGDQSIQNADYAKCMSLVASINQSLSNNTQEELTLLSTLMDFDKRTENMRGFRTFFNGTDGINIINYKQLQQLHHRVQVFEKIVENNGSSNGSITFTLDFIRKNKSRLKQYLELFENATTGTLFDAAFENKPKDAVLNFFSNNAQLVQSVEEIRSFIVAYIAKDAPIFDNIYCMNNINPNGTSITSDNQTFVFNENDDTMTFNFDDRVLYNYMSQSMRNVPNTNYIRREKASMTILLG